MICSRVSRAFFVVIGVNFDGSSHLRRTSCDELFFVMPVNLPANICTKPERLGKSGSPCYVRSVRFRSKAGVGVHQAMSAKGQQRALTFLGSL